MNIWDNPGVQSFIGNLPLLITGLIAMSIFLKQAKNFNYKKGDTELSFNAKQEMLKPVVKVLTEYADWKAEFQKEYTKDFNSINMEAKQLTVTSIQGHLSLLTQKYTEVLDKSKQPKKQYTTKHFLSLFTAVIYPDILDLTMTIYEQNHLADKTDEFIDQLMERRYEDLKNIYRSAIQKYWFNDLLPYQDFIDCMKTAEPEFKHTLATLINYYRELSTKKKTLNEAYSKLDVDIKKSVNENYLLPVDAYVRLHNLYNSGI